MEARLKTRLSCSEGAPPDAVHMSSKLVDPEPVQNTQWVCRTGKTTAGLPHHLPHKWLCPT